MWGLDFLGIRPEQIRIYFADSTCSSLHVFLSKGIPDCICLIFQSSWDLFGGRVKGSWKTRSINCSLESRVSGGSWREQMWRASQDLSQDTPWLRDCMCNISSCMTDQRLQVTDLVLDPGCKWLSKSNQNTTKQKEMNEKRQSQRIYKTLLQMSMQIKIPKYRSKINAKKAVKLMSGEWVHCVWNENDLN